MVLHSSVRRVKQECGNDTSQDLTFGHVSMRCGAAGGHEESASLHHWPGSRKAEAILIPGRASSHSTKVGLRCRVGGQHARDSSAEVESVTEGKGDGPRK